MHAREAILPDVAAIHAIIVNNSQTGTLLPRSMGELCENIRDFMVVEDESRIVGCGALHLYGPHLTEVRSIAVLPEYQGCGAGRILMDALFREAQRHNITAVCLFTRIPKFFARFGFDVARREDLPDKIYKDCINCPKLHACDEVAMIKGAIPKYANLGGIRVADSLVQLQH